jgi:hypothetical protein
VCVLTGCSKPEPPATASPAPTEPQQVDAVAQASMNLNGLSADLGQFVSIRRNKPVDFAFLKQLYERNLQNYVTKVDESYGTQLDAIVSQAIEQGLKGQDIPANVQWAEKTIQQAFILDFLTSLERFGEPALWSRIKAAAPVLRAIAERRGAWTGRDSEYPDLFDALLRQIESHAAAREATPLRQGKEQLAGLMRKMLVLSIFYELSGCEKARGGNPNEAVEKVVEAQIYFQSVAEEGRKRDAAVAEAIAGELAKKPDQVDIDLVRSLLRNLYEPEVKDIDGALLGA